MIMQVSQIFLSTKDKASRKELPVPIIMAMATVKDAFPDADYQFYDNERILDFLKRCHGWPAYNAFLSLQSLAYRCDLARYCLLHEYGGWYFDCGLTCHTGVELAPRIELLAFRSIQRFAMNSWACDNGLIFAKPQHPALAAAIDNALTNVTKKYYGITPLCPTGPSLWGKSIAQVSQETMEGMVFGDCMELTPSHARKNKSFVLPDGTILAACKPTGGGDLKGMGAADTNNYNDLWHGRTVYE